jgi:hypothetical protein
MKQSWNGCGVHRESVCLLASDVQSGDEIAGVEKHLATCARCREYYDSIKCVSAPFTNWEKSFSHVEANQRIQAQWAREFQTAVEPDSSRRSAFLTSFGGWCRDLIWPCRRAWTGFAAVWLAILALNYSSREKPQSLPLTSSRPSLETVQAYLEHEGFLPASNTTDERRRANPAKPPLPSPRSDRGRGMNTSA